MGVGSGDSADMAPVNLIGRETVAVVLNLSTDP